MATRRTAGIGKLTSATTLPLPQQYYGAGMDQCIMRCKGEGIRLRTKRPLICGGSAPQFVRVPTGKAMGPIFLVHWEGNNNLHRTVHRIKALGKRAGVVINPATPAAVLEEILPDVDQVLVMTVDPGFGHQAFLHTTLPKIRRVCQMIERIKPGCDLVVDGGINETTAPLAVAAGANVLVAGSAIFAASDGITAAMDRLRAAITHSL